MELITTPYPHLLHHHGEGTVEELRVRRRRGGRLTIAVTEH